jgi:hypothetical protein
MGTELSLMNGGMGVVVVVVVVVFLILIKHCM